MKNCKCNFLSVIAVLAIALTAFTNPKVFTHKKPPTISCLRPNPPFTAGDYVKGTFKRISDGTVYSGLYNDDVTTGTSTLCPLDDSDEFCLNLIAVKVQPTADFFCDEGPDEFCCAKIISPDSPCGTNPDGRPDFTGYAKKVRIYCKSLD